MKKLLVDDLDASQNLIKDIKCFFDAEDFATGFALPVDVVVGPNGSLYVVDYATGIIFRVDYQR